MRAKFSLKLLLLLIFVLMSLLSPILPFVSPVSILQGNTTVVRVNPEKVTMGPEPAVGQQFTIDIILENVADLYGWEAKLFWDNSLLNCTGEEYPILPESLNWEAPNSLLLGPGIEQDFNETHGRWYHGLSALPMAAPYPESFTGTIKLATLTFEVISQPPKGGSCALDLLHTKFATDVTVPVMHDIVDGYYEILSAPKPQLSIWIEPRDLTVYAGYVFDIDVMIENVESAAMLVGAEFKLRYNTTMLNVIDATEGLFMKDPSWALNGAVVAGPHIEEDYVLLAILLLPHVDGEWTAFPEGSGTLATITFNASAVGNCALELFDTKLGSSQTESISHTTANGFVTVTEVTISYDLNGDGVVNVFDIIVATPALGSYPGHPRWSPVADMNRNDVVDIFDLILIAINFSKAA